MNNRRSFIKDTLVILCASMLPKILRPSEFVVNKPQPPTPVEFYPDEIHFGEMKNRGYWWVQYPGKRMQVYFVRSINDKIEVIEI